MSLALIFFIVALILFILAALNVASPRFSLGWAGMAFIAAGMVFGRVSF